MLALLSTFFFRSLIFGHEIHQHNQYSISVNIHRDHVLISLTAYACLAMNTFPLSLTISLFFKKHEYLPDNHYRLVSLVASACLAMNFLLNSCPGSALCLTRSFMIIIIIMRFLCYLTLSFAQIILCLTRSFMITINIIMRFLCYLMLSYAHVILKHRCLNMSFMITINITMRYLCYLFFQCADNLASWKKLAEEKKGDQEE